MLSEEEAHNLGLKGKYYHHIKSPAFTNANHLWFKSQDIPQPYPENKIHELNFFKIGKTFGFETTRYLQFKNGILYYYEGSKDSSYKGYCRLDNVYIFYLDLGSSKLLHLTNGAEYSQFFFKDHSFISNISNTFFCHVIQVNFSEKYTLENMIGKGSFSKVYLGKNRKTEQKVAIKIVSKKDKHGAPTKSIVDEEKRILTLLHSDNVCRMLQFFQEDDIFIFVLQFLPGLDLFKLFKEKSDFSLFSLIKIFKSILQGLIHIHSKNIIHRDIKPQNIIVNEATFDAKLIDFGLSLLVTNNTPKRAYKRCGTMGYMALEVIKNTAENRKVYNEKCDMFSFGIIAHMMLMDRNPLKGKNYEETYHKNSECDITLEKDLIVKKYGSSCVEFLEGLLMPDPNYRWSAQQAYNSKFIKEKTMDTETILKSEEKGKIEEKEQFSPEKVRESSDVDQEQIQIQKPKQHSIVARKVNF